MALVPINSRAPNCGAHGACSRKFLTAKLRCGWPDIVGDRPSSGMISDNCDFTMSSTFSATSQLLDVKRAGDRELARLRRRFVSPAHKEGCRDWRDQYLDR